MDGRIHVLMIDDNPDDRALVRRELESGFGKIRTTDIIDAADLEAALGRDDFDLVITDYQLRWTDGLKVLRAVRQRDLNCPVLMYTGTGSEEVAVAAMKLGLDEYVIKSAAKLPQIRLAAEAAMRKALQRRNLREQEERTKTILETVVDGIIAIDERGLIQSFNPAAERLFGYTADDVIGENVKILMPEARQSEHDGYLSRYLKTGKGSIIGISREVEGRAKDGHVFPMELAVGETRLRSGKRHFIGSVRDLTERKQMEEQLRGSQKMEAVGQLTGGLAHDFNNILTVILGNLELAAERSGHDTALQTAIGYAKDASERGAALIRRLLAFSRHQAIQPQTIDLNNAVLDVLEMIRRTIGDNIQVKTVSADGLWNVLADKNQIENVILNFAINARDAMPSGGTLTIETRNVRFEAEDRRSNPEFAAGDYVRISVTDTGVGMPPEVVARAFEPFFTTKDVGKGTGLGLSMVYGIARQSNGHVEIESQIGRGTTVHFYLPRCHLCGARPVAESEGELLAPRDGETILVVEDDELVRNTVTEQLNRLGYRVLTAPDGRQAVKILQGSDPIHLLFTDIVMPGGMGGRELACECARLRPNVRIIFTSGYSDSGVRTDSAIDNIDLLPKPYRKQELARKIRKVLDQTGT